MTLQPQDCPPEVVCFLSNHGVVVVVIKTDSVRSRSGACHAHCVRPIVLQIVAKLNLKLFARNAFASGAVSEGVPDLNHELRNDVVEDNASEVFISSVTIGVFDGRRSSLWGQSDADSPERRADRRFVGEGPWVVR